MLVLLLPTLSFAQSAPDLPVSVRAKERAARKDSIDRGIWQIDLTLGATSWGEESPCRCNAFTSQFGFEYVAPLGWSLGAALVQTETGAVTLTPALRVGYRPVTKVRGWDFPLGAHFLIGRSISNLGRGNVFAPIDDYNGLLYGGQLTLLTPPTRRSALRGTLGFGWLTSRERITQDFWGSESSIKTVHSGWRISFGVTW